MTPLMGAAVSARSATVALLRRARVDEELLRPTLEGTLPVRLAFPQVEAALGLLPGFGATLLEELARAGFLESELDAFVTPCARCGARSRVAAGRGSWPLACEECGLELQPEDRVRVERYRLTARARRLLELEDLLGARASHTANEIEE